MLRRLVLATLITFASATAALATPAVSPILHDLGAGVALQSLNSAQGALAPRTVDLIVRGTMNDADLEAAGAVIGTRLPDGTRTLSIPVARFGELKNVPGLARISASYTCTPLNNTSVPLTNATPGYWSHTGSGVFTGDAGANVIVGMVDSGVDWSHDDFKNPDGTSRILALWDQTVTASPPAGYSYGTAWTQAQINAGSCTHHDTNGHGTHVLGSAAGDGSATGNAQPAYVDIGMAPKADLVVVATDFSTAHIIDGVNWIFQKAAAAGKNAVVNLSLGTNYGAHDGTETFDTALDALTGAGKIIVAAAGNAGGQSLHAHQLVASGAGAQTVTFNVPTFTANAGTNNDFIVIDGYYPSTANMTVTITSPGPSPVTVGPVALGTAGSNVGTAGTIYVENGATPSAGGDKNLFVQLYDSNASYPPRAGVWTITLTPVTTTASTAWDGWLAQFQLGAAGAAATFTSDVDESDLVASPGSASQVITVGSLVSKASWLALDGSSHSYVGLTNTGGIAAYSSHGPLRNGAIKPDIAAPGSAIVSAKSAWTSPATALQAPDGVHVVMTGTSMASPHVTGAVALLLATTPNQTPAQLKSTLTAQATVDAYTGTVPNGTWGYGKLHLSSTADATAPTVAITAPNGGETWAAGSSHAITWTASDNVGVTAIALDYSTDNGATWTPIASGLANAGTYSWTLPQAAAAQARVRATARDAASNSANDASDAAFTLADQTAPSVTVTAPNGGEIWGVGETHDVTWTASDNIGVTTIDLAVSTDDGTTWTPIATGLANTGSWSWAISAAPTAEGVVRAVAHDAAGNSSLDLGNAAFTVQPTAGVTNGAIHFATPTLVSNRPNPFAVATHIGFGLPRAAHVSVRVYGVDGRLVRTLADESFAAGYTELAWDGRTNAGERAASGVYFCRFEADGAKHARRVVLE